MEVENVCDVLGTPGPWRIRRLGDGKGYRIYAASNKALIAEVPAGHVASGISNN